jgi:hypothetical protein
MTDKTVLLELVDELAGYDHCFISREGVLHFTKPFGFEGTTYVARNSDDPKGLTLAAGLDELEGQDAAEVAREICRHLKVDFPPMYGRGSQLRICCELLRRHLQD